MRPIAIGVVLLFMPAFVSGQSALVSGRVEEVRSRYVRSAAGDEIIESTLRLGGGQEVVVTGGTIGPFTMRSSAHDLFAIGDEGAFLVRGHRAERSMRFGSDAYLARIYRWPSSTVSYYVNPANLDMSASAAVTSIQAAAAGWFTQADISLQMVYAGQITGGALTKNGRNEVFFRNEDHGSVIAEVYWWYDSQNRFVDADMVFYDRKRFFPGSTGCASGYYLVDIATHEFGHWYGLGHSTVSGATMWPSAGTCSTVTRSLAADDIAGVESMYGIDGGTEPEPVPGSGTITLKKMEVRLTLLWSGLAGTGVDVYLNGVKKWTTTNDGVQVFTVSPAASWMFWICEAGTMTCASATVVYP
jgi:hypothetical protein